MWGGWISLLEVDRGLVWAVGLLEAEFVGWCQGELISCSPDWQNVASKLLVFPQR